MDKSNIPRVIIMALCCFGCAVLFYGIGIWADKSEKPVHFWSGTTVDPTKVTDIPGYNHACAVMWKWYSVPYWLSGIFSCLDPWYDGSMIVATVLLVAACVPGFIFLVLRYHRIVKTYISR